MIEQAENGREPEPQSAQPNIKVFDQVGEHFDLMAELQSTREKGIYQEAYWRKEMSDGTKFLMRLTPDGKRIVITEHNGQITSDISDMNARVVPVPNHPVYRRQLFNLSNWRIMRNYEYLGEEVLAVEAKKPVLPYVTQIVSIQEQATPEEIAEKTSIVDEFRSLLVKSTKSDQRLEVEARRYSDVIIKSTQPAQTLPPEPQQIPGVSAPSSIELEPATLEKPTESKEVDGQLIFEWDKVDLLPETTNRKKKENLSGSQKPLRVSTMQMVSELPIPNVDQGKSKVFILDEDVTVFGLSPELRSLITPQEIEEIRRSSLTPSEMNRKLKKFARARLREKGKVPKKIASVVVQFK